MNLENLKTEVEELRSEIAELVDIEEISPEQDARLDEAIAEFEAKSGQLAAAEERAAKVAEIRARDDLRALPGWDTGPSFIRKVDTNVDAAGPIDEVRDAARKIIEESRFVDPADQAHVERLVLRNSANASGDAIARRLVATERPEYRSAFLKGVTGNAALLSDDERRAVAEVRAMSSSDTAGGFGVPILIDPTVLITGGKGLTGILSYVRVEQITNDAWKGVSAASTSWSFDQEAAQVSDDASTFAQPSVPVHKAQGFIPASLEIAQDYPGLANELGRLLMDGYMDLLASKLATGSGSDEPTGIFTALDANTNVEVVTTTDGLFGAVDIDKVWKSVPEKFRARSVWFMNVDVENEIRAFGSGTATSRFTVDQTAEGISLLNGKPVVLSDYAPEFTGTTGAANILVVGDFSNYVVAQRVGMTVVDVPVLFGANQRPTGQRGWYAYARVGADAVVDNAFRLLQNQ